ncbi:MAG: hypothetical protein ACMXYA_02910, partial [Candidatus Woesearchaeota archaeon]
MNFFERFLLGLANILPTFYKDSLYKTISFANIKTRPGVIGGGVAFVCLSLIFFSVVGTIFYDFGLTQEERNELFEDEELTVFEMDQQIQNARYLDMFIYFVISLILVITYPFIVSTYYFLLMDRRVKDVEKVLPYALNLIA